MLLITVAFLLTPDVKYFMSFQLFSLLRKLLRDFPGGNTVDKNLPASAGDMGLSPGPVRSHMLFSS